MYSRRHLDRGPEALEACIEVAIRHLIIEDIGFQRLERMRQAQLAFFVKVIQRVYLNRGRSLTYSDYLALAEGLMALSSLSVVGVESIPDPSQGLVVVTNHFGVAKLTKIDAGQIASALLSYIDDREWLDRLNAPPNNEPFPLRAAAIFATLFHLLGREVVAPHQVHMWYPYPFNEVQQDCGIVGTFRDRSGQYATVERGLDALFDNALSTRKLPVAVLSPESGTSGKRGVNSNPYELGEFRRGFAVYARHRRLPVLPIVQCIRSDGTFRTRVLDALTPNEWDRTAIREVAQYLQVEMQQALNSLVANE